MSVYVLSIFTVCIHKQAPLVALMVKNPHAMQETWVGKIPWRKERLSTPVFWHGESHRLYIVHGLANSPWGRKELEMTEWLSLSYTHIYIV